MQLTQSAVKQLALKHNIPVMQPLTLKAEEVQQQLSAYRADVMVVAAYGLILPTTVLQMPRYGCLNIHASLLPRWRGAAPIQRAILAGDVETGITIMQMDEGLDTGAMILKKTCAICDHDTAETLHDKLALLGAVTINEALVKLKQGKLISSPQDSTQVSYAGKLTKSEAQIHWTHDSVQIERAVRAYNPFPVAYSSINGTTVKIWQASKSEDGQGVAGSVLAINKRGIQVACGQGALYLEILQRANGKSLPADQFTQGFAVKVGDQFVEL